MFNRCCKDYLALIHSKKLFKLYKAEKSEAIFEDCNSQQYKMAKSSRLILVYYVIIHFTICFFALKLSRLIILNLILKLKSLYDK